MCYLTISSVIHYVKRYPPDGLLTSEQTKDEETPHIIAPDPPSPDDLNACNLHYLFPSTSTDELSIMSTGEEESSSGVNGRLRPRKANAVQPQRATRKTDTRHALDRPKRATTPSKVTPTKSDDLANKSDATFTALQLCPYCDRKFNSKQNVFNHIRRVHFTPTKQDSSTSCLFCSHFETDPNDIIRHMVDNHPNHYFACLDCHTRLVSTIELAEHKLNGCEKQKPSYRSKSRQKTSPKTKKSQKQLIVNSKEDYRSGDSGGFNGVVISCELKPSQVHDEADIEDNITTNLILPPSKALSNSVIEKNAVIILDDIQWNKRIPSNFSFHNTDADQILSRLGVVHKSPRAGGESSKKPGFKLIDEANQKFERCFDTSFYSKVASNVQENLTKFLDGSCNFNPDPENVIKTRKSKNNVVINTVEGFPILLAKEQLTRNIFETYLPRAIAPKHKWKWDSTDNDKITTISDQIKRDSHTDHCIVSLVSKLDIWTQICMRRKFEEKYGAPPLEKKTEKQNTLSLELKEILESRDIPAKRDVAVASTSRGEGTVSTLGGAMPPAWLGLQRTTQQPPPPPAIVSGEWARPRCYVCCACGHQTHDPRAVTAHANTAHPNAQVQHYEIVGERLLEPDILKHLYVPPAQVVNRTRPPRGFRDCTKCNKSVSLEELHQHMLECAGDVPAVRRKVRPRPFGARRRRMRLPDNTVRKKIRKQLRTRHTRQNNRLRRTRPKIRSEVGDAETIRKMIADLPAKRHRVLINPTNTNRPQRTIDKQRNKIIIKRRGTDDLKSRRLRVNKEASTHPANETTSSASATKLESNDDDDKPLKPPSARMSTRRTEALKRNKQTFLLNRVKRKTVKSQEPDEVKEIFEAAETTKNSQDSFGDTNRIEVRQGPSLSRQHSDMGQRESANSGHHNDNHENKGHGMNAPDFNVPAPTAPLKHSIARITAKPDTDHKAVLFHRRFQIQQSCSNFFQHGPKEHDRRIDNEAVKTKLDKPPLTDFTRYSSDNKHRPNKPRKGLNACIAMLKNKLTEPNSNTIVPVDDLVLRRPDDPKLRGQGDPKLREPDDPNIEPLKILTATSNVNDSTNKPEALETTQTADAIYDSVKTQDTSENLLQIGSKNIFDNVCEESELSQVISVVVSNDHQKFTDPSDSQDRKKDSKKEVVLDKNSQSDTVDTNITDKNNGNTVEIPKYQLCELAAHIQIISPKFCGVVSLSDQILEAAESSQRLLQTSESGVQLLEGTTPDLITKLSERLDNLPENANNTDMKNINLDKTPVTDENINDQRLTKPTGQDKTSQQEKNTEKEDVSTSNNKDTTTSCNEDITLSSNDDTTTASNDKTTVSETLAQDTNLNKVHQCDASEVKTANTDKPDTINPNSVQNDIMQRENPWSTMCQSKHEINQSYALAYENNTEENLREATLKNQFINKFNPNEALVLYENNRDINTIKSYNLNQGNAFLNDARDNLYHQYQAAEIGQYSFNNHVDECYGDSMRSSMMNVREQESEIHVKNIHDLELNFSQTFYNESQYPPQVHPARVGVLIMESNVPLDLSKKAQNSDICDNQKEDNRENYHNSKLSSVTSEPLRLTPDEQPLHEMVNMHFRTPHEAYPRPLTPQSNERLPLHESFYPHAISHNNFLPTELSSSDAICPGNDPQQMQYGYGMPLSNPRYCPDVPVTSNSNEIPSSNNLRTQPEVEVPYVPAEYCLSPKRQPGSVDISVKGDPDLMHMHRNIPLMQNESQNMEPVNNYDDLKNYAFDGHNSCDYPLSESYRSNNTSIIDHIEPARSDRSISPNYYMISPTSNHAINKPVPLPMLLAQTPTIHHPQGLYCSSAHSVPEFTSNVMITDNHNTHNFTISNDDSTFNNERQCLVPLPAPCSAPIAAAFLHTVPGRSKSEISFISPSRKDSVTEDEAKQNHTHENTESTIKEPCKDKELSKTTLNQQDIDEDPETAKKIAMLPKELVEIIGTMPPDHRNQLLNILPQYVSNSTAPSIKKSEPKNVTPPSLGASTESHDSSTSSETKGSIKKKVEDMSQATCPQEITSVKSSTEVSNNTLNTSVSSIETACVSEEIVPVERERNNTTDNIIDLTDDENIHVKIISNSNNDHTPSSVTNEKVGPGPVPSTKPKAINEQTASLRAVRIKTALERNKSNITGAKSLQQAEISSTQQNKLKLMAKKDINPTNQLNETNQLNLINQPNPVQQLNPTNNGIPMEELPLEIIVAESENNTEPAINVQEIKLEPELKDTPEKYMLNNQELNESSEKDHEDRYENEQEDVSQKELLDEPNLNINSDDTTLVESGLIDPSKTIDDTTSNSNSGRITEVIGEAIDSNIQSPEEDDSEDDVSLALIVQKKINQTKDSFEIKLSEKSVIDLPKTKKSRKKTAKVKPVVRINEIETNVVSDPPKHDLNSKSDSISTENKVEHSKKRSKKRSKKKRSHTVPYAHDTQTEHHKSDSGDQGISDTNAVEKHKLNVSIKLSASEEITQVHNDVNDRLVDNKSSNNVEKFTKRPPTKLKMSDILYRGQNSTSENKNAYFDVNDEIMTKKVKPNKVNHKGQILINSTNLSLKIPFNKKERVPLAASNSCEPLLNIEKETIIIEEDKMHTAAPLRRSRRGKSLFVEKLEYDSEVPETTEEKMEIITKKVALNEEEHIIKTSEDQKLFENYQESLNLLCQNADSGDRIEDRAKGDKTLFPSSTENKSLKRKKSLSKQKQKKIKSDDHFKADPVEGSKNSIEDLTVCVEKAHTPAINPQAITDNISCSTPKTDDSTVDKVAKTSTSADKKKVVLKLDSELTPNTKSIMFKISLHDNSKNSLVLPHENITNFSFENKSTPCYSQPLAARRIRSKSVGVKQSSSTEAYDPYDIDLDDMIEKVEKFGRQAKKESKKAKSKSKSKSNDTKGNKNELYGKNDKKTDEVSHAAVDEVNDSDSSKSDVPLKSYVRSKELKSLVDKKGGKSSQKVVSENPKTEIQQSETNNDDNDLQSEKFMESFGFFSERKPRKSNLLATKKISETFHMIDNEREDIYSQRKQKTDKKNSQDHKEPPNVEPVTEHEPSTSKTITSQRKRMKRRTTHKRRRCSICKKGFRLPYNYIRHLMTLRHIAKVSEIELKLKTNSIKGKPNYFVVFKRQIKKIKFLQTILDKRKKNSKTPYAPLPTMKEFLRALKKIVKEEHIAKSLSQDEELFLDCCELLKENPRNDRQKTEMTKETTVTNLNVEVPQSYAQNTLPPSSTQECVPHCSTQECVSLSCSQQYIQSSPGACVDQSSKEEEYVPRMYTEGATIHQHNIMNEETYDYKSDGDVDSITAKTILESEEVRNLENDLITGLKEAAIAKRAANMQHISLISSTEALKPSAETRKNMLSPISGYVVDRTDKPEVEETANIKQKKYPEIKEKMYPDILIEDIDMYEDKFDKIKRKCRSQAAAAKQAQTIIENTTNSSSQKSRKKSEKKKIKKNKKNQHNTVLTKGALKGFDGIKTATSNPEAHPPPVQESTMKKKKKSSSKKKRDQKPSGSSSKYEGEHRTKDSSQKILDVYEFMDNEDAELFEFRPSTLMERFKSMSNKDNATSSKSKVNTNNADATSESGSDGDDFVYMSDDYVCSDDETENSILSCELHNTKAIADVKKIASPQKRKELVDKSAVMGKIFRNNVVRGDKKVVKSKDNAKPKANLDQLFDSLLQNKEPVMDKDQPFTKKAEYSGVKSDASAKPKKFVTAGTQYEPLLIETENRLSPSKDNSTVTKQITSPLERISSSVKRQPSVSPRIRVASPKKISSPARTMTPDNHSPIRDPYCDDSVEGLTSQIGSKISKTYNTTLQLFDETTYQSHDGFRNKKYLSKSKTSKYKRMASKERSSGSSAEEGVDEVCVSDAEMGAVAEAEAGVARQRARRKCTVGKQNVLAESWSSESEGEGSGAGRGRRRSPAGAARRRAPRATAPAQPSYWAAGADDPQRPQHGWIVGDSHKKLVTMLAHAKGRKRHHDDRRHLLD